MCYVELRPRPARRLVPLLEGLPRAEPRRPAEVGADPSQGQGLVRFIYFALDSTKLTLPQDSTQLRARSQPRAH